MRTLFADLYPVRKLLIDHFVLLQPKGFSESVQMDVSVSQHLHPHRSTPHLWVGMILQSKGDLGAAARAYNLSKRLSQPYDWQASYRLWKALLLLGDAHQAALEESKRQLREAQAMGQQERARADASCAGGRAGRLLEACVNLLGVHV